MSGETAPVALWHVDPACVGYLKTVEPSWRDGEGLEAVWAAAHEPHPVGELPAVRARASGATVSSICYIEEAEVLVHSDAVRAAVERVRGSASEHVWLPVTVELDGEDLTYWLLSCQVPDVALPDRSVNAALVRDAAVVHYEVGDNFPAFVDRARDAIERDCPDVRFLPAGP